MTIQFTEAQKAAFFDQLVSSGKLDVTSLLADFSKTLEQEIGTGLASFPFHQL
jgi:hypothetical protein